MEQLNGSAADWSFGLGQGGGGGKKPRAPKGKNEAVHLPGKKNELRRALIDKKRAERASKAGHFEALVLFNALHDRLLEDDSQWNSPPLGKVALKVASKIGKLLQYRCTEQGSGDRRVLVFTRDVSHPMPTGTAVDDARAAAADFDATASGAAAGAVLQEQRATVRRIREKKVAAAGSAPISKKLRQIYRDESSDGEEEGKRDNGGEAEGTRLRMRLVSVVRKPIAFVRASIPAGKGGDAVPEDELPSEHTAGKYLDSDEGEECSLQDDEGENGTLQDDEGEESDAPGVADGNVAGDDDTDMPGLGMQMSALSVLGSDWTGGGRGAGAEATEEAPEQTQSTGRAPAIEAYWESHTRGVGSKLLARMGYTGGQLPGSCTPGAGASTRQDGQAVAGQGVAENLAVLAKMGTLEYLLPTPIGEHIVLKKDRKGIGHER